MTDGHMARAISLARRAQGATSPNPPVGAVLVKNGTVVGEGFTKPAGQAHAEIVALTSAGSEAAGSTLYVTLEPCSHWGRTPPCADALIAAGITSAHIALLDPNPAVNGAGVLRLEQHGVEVTVGECAEEAAELVEAHAKYISTGTPFLTLLRALPNAVTERIEAVTDAILTDRKAARRSRAEGQGFIRPPLLVLIDGDADSEALSDPRTIMVTAQPLTAAGQGSERESQILRLPAAGGWIDFASLLEELGRHEITCCVAVGSDELAKALLERELVDKIVSGMDEPGPAGFRSGRPHWDPAPHIVRYRSSA